MTLTTSTGCAAGNGEATGGPGCTQRDGGGGGNPAPAGARQAQARVRSRQYHLSYCGVVVVVAVVVCCCRRCRVVVAVVVVSTVAPPPSTHPGCDCHQHARAMHALLCLRGLVNIDPTTQKCRVYATFQIPIRLRCPNVQNKAVPGCALRGSGDDFRGLFSLFPVSDSFGRFRCNNREVAKKGNK